MEGGLKWQKVCFREKKLQVRLSESWVPRITWCLFPVIFILKKKKNPGHFNSVFYPSYAFLPLLLVWRYFSFFFHFLFLSSESTLHPLPLQPYFRRICLCLGSLFSLPFFHLLLSSWILSPKRVGSRPTKFSVSAVSSAPRTVRYLIALWWLWLMMFSTYTNSREKYTPPIRWIAYKCTLKTRLQQTILDNRVFKFLLEAIHTHTQDINGDTTFIIFFKAKASCRWGVGEECQWKTYTT